MSSISREQVAHLAMLARIEMSESELDTLAGEMDVILDAVAKVTEVASEDVPPMANPVEMHNVTRPDTPVPSLPLEQALAGAPEAEDGQFVVPRILAEN